MTRVFRTVVTPTDMWFAIGRTICVFLCIWVISVRKSKFTPFAGEAMLNTQMVFFAWRRRRRFTSFRHEGSFRQAGIESPKEGEDQGSQDQENHHSVISSLLQDIVRKIEYRFTESVFFKFRKTHYKQQLLLFSS